MYRYPVKQYYLVIILVILLLSFIQLSFPAYAIREPRPTAIDSRIRVLVYNPNDVFKYTGYYGYQTSIEFAEDEEVVSISMGDTSAWQISVAGFRIFIKPVEQYATTNMTLITNKRTYFFELYAQSTTDIRDPNLVFNVKFIYPDDMDDNISSKLANNNSNDKMMSDISINKLDLSRPEIYNFLYTISGNEEVAPIKIFDDGEFTYMQFRDKNYEMPAVFAVDEELRESMVNVKPDPTSDNTIIIEQVFPKLVLRRGNKIVCVFNEAFRKY